MNFRRVLSGCAVAILPLVAGIAAEPGADTSAPARPVSTVDPATVRRWFEGWKAPVPPRQLVGNIHYVGASGVSSFLITTPAGHIILDTGFEDTVPLIQQGIEQLGFRLEDVKLLLSSHAHVDHVGGHALMKRLTGARVVASAADAATLQSGGEDDFTPLPRELMRFAPVVVDQIVADRETIELGGVRLTAHLTRGHTRGATTWTTTVEVEGNSRAVVFFSSTSINPGTVLRDNPLYPTIVQDYEATFARLRELRCDIFFAPHGGQFAMLEKFARLARGESDAFVDPTGWDALLTDAEQTFRAQLAAEDAARRETDVPEA